MRRAWVCWAVVQTSAGAAMAQSRPQEAPPVAPQQQPAELPHPWRERPLAFDATLGIATPYGLAGLSAEYAPIEHLSFSAGVGTNIYGWQLAGMTRLRFTPEQRSSIYAGAGYSQGKHEQWEGNHDGVFSLFLGPMTANGHNPKRGHTWETARWLNFELGLERREARGVDARVFGGSAFLLNPGAGVVDEPSNGAYQSDVLAVRGLMIYAGAALGFAL